jgi:hypothetical protein
VQLERGGTTPLLGRTQYFLGLVVLTYYPHISQQEKNQRLNRRQTQIITKFPRILWHNETVNHLKGDGTAGPVGEPQGAGDLLAENNCACHEIEIEDQNSPTKKIAEIL